MNQASELCPILLEVIDPKLEELMGMQNRQLIKIFDRNGNMLFQKSLQRLINWNLFQNIFVMVTDEQIVYNEKLQGVITIVVFPFKSNCVVFKVLVEEYPSLDSVTDLGFDGENLIFRDRDRPSELKIVPLADQIDFVKYN